MSAKTYFWQIKVFPFLISIFLTEHSQIFLNYFGFQVSHSHFTPTPLIHPFIYSSFFFVDSHIKQFGINEDYNFQSLKIQLLLVSGTTAEVQC